MNCYPNLSFNTKFDLLSSKVWYILHFGTISSNFQDTDVIITLNNITRTTSHNSLSLNTNSSNVTYIHNILNRRTKHVQPVIQESYPLELIQKEKKNYSKHTYSTNHFSMLGKQTKRKWKKKNTNKKWYHRPTCGTCVDLPQPVSPTNITVWYSSKQYSNWSRYLRIGRRSRCASMANEWFALKTNVVTLSSVGWASRSDANESSSIL